MLTTLRRASEIASLAWPGLSMAHPKSREAARRHMAHKLGRLRGLPQKVGQMLAFSDRPVDAFQDLYEASEPLPWSDLEPVLAKAWQCDPAEVLSEVDPVGHAASLGQVHQARLHDGRMVAIKIQYPGIRDACLADVSLLNWISAPLGGLSRGFDLADYRQTLLGDLELELDYQSEAARQREFHAWSQGNGFLVVPTVIDEWTRPNVLMSEWMQGETWNEARVGWSLDERTTWSRDCVRWFFEGLFVRGMMHADLHPGNVRFLRGPRHSPRWLLYDFGCALRLTESERGALARLIRSAQTRGEPPLPWFEALGFSRVWLAPLEEKLPALCRTLFEPLVVDAPYDLADWNLSDRLRDVLGDDRWNFRVAGPARLVWLLRAWHGIRVYLEGFGASVNWRREAESTLAQAERLSPSVSMASTSATGYDRLARWLKVRVKRDGETKVELTLPADRVEHVGELLDETTRQRIEEQGHSIAEAIAAARRNQYGPGNLFAITDGDREVRVWLE